MRNRDGGQYRGLRERKRRELLRHIAIGGLKLFNERGFEATTTLEIAKAAGISPRTLYYHFSTKDEMLHFLVSDGLLEATSSRLGRSSDSMSRLDMVYDCLSSFIPHFESDVFIAVYRILDETGGLNVRKQAIFVEVETTLFSALRPLWPNFDSRQLRSLAMMGAGALRLALEAKQADLNPGPLIEYLDLQMACLREILANGHH